MATVNQIMRALKSKGNDKRRDLFSRRGAGDRLFGVSVADMKVIARGIKGEQELAAELYETGNYDAMYLAGMVADGRQMTRTQLQRWARAADWQLISEYTVPWVASESKHGHDLANQWISSRKEHIAACGWSTWAGLVSTVPDEELDLAEVRSLLKRIEEEIDAAPDRVRYTMNGFVIAVGSYVKPLAGAAKATARRLGKVSVNMQGTSCKVPVALDYIARVEGSGRAGKKRKTIRC